MEDLITELRNKTQMGRFTRGEVAVILEFLRAGGYLREEPKLANENPFRLPSA